VKPPLAGKYGGPSAGSACNAAYYEGCKINWPRVKKYDKNANNEVTIKN